MGVLNVKKYNAMQAEREQYYLNKLEVKLTDKELKEWKENYFPRINKSYGFVTFDDRTKCTEIHWHKRKPY